MRKRQSRWEKMDKSDIELQVLIQHFEVHNKTEGKSPRTVEWYNQVLNMFLAFLREKGLPTTLSSIGEHEVRQFILHIQSKPGIKGAMSTHSVANRVRALRAFFAWLRRRGYLGEDPIKDLKPPKTLDQVIEPLTEEEMERIFSAINPNTALGARNTAIISLLVDAGLRLSELLDLKEHDAHLQERYVKVVGKGSKERMVAFGVACQRSLMHYYHHFRVQPATPIIDNFFLTIDGYPLTKHGLTSMVERLSIASGVKRLHPHLLRHTYATQFLLNGGDVFLLKQNLGHTTLTMVEHYLHIASRSAAVRSQGFSPLDRYNVKDSRRFRHSFNGTLAGHIYPNAGKRHKRVRQG